MSQLIPQTDPGANYRAHRQEIDAAIARVLDLGWYILGEEVRAFEQEFARFVGAADAVGVGSGTDALVIALRAVGVQPGQHVITVAHTAVATVAAVELAGAVPILVDIDPATYCIDPNQVQSALAMAAERGQHVAAIVPVHLYGHPAPVEQIMAVAEAHGVAVVEDCAQAHGATIGGRAVGTFGAAAAFSFYPTKNLGALGDGGAVVSCDRGIAERARLLREYGWRERYVSSLAGTNSRLDELQAAALRVKLPHLAAENERRRAIAARYNRLLAESCAVLPNHADHLRHVYHQYVVRVADRDAVRGQLRDLGVGTLVHYPVPVHLQPAYAGRIATPFGMEHTERAALEIMSLPIFPELSDGDVDRVGDAVMRVVGRRAVASNPIL